jgi:hypothetical protein
MAYCGQLATVCWLAQYGIWCSVREPFIPSRSVPFLCSRSHSSACACTGIGPEHCVRTATHMLSFWVYGSTGRGVRSEQHRGHVSASQLTRSAQLGWLPDLFDFTPAVAHRHVRTPSMATSVYTIARRTLGG